MEDTILNTQLSEIRLQILGDTDNTSKDDIFKIMLKRAKYIALGTLYPYDFEITELPQRIQEDWQVRCAIELYEKMDATNVQSYSENGLSITYFTGLLSSNLIHELTPKAGVPK